MLKLICVGKIKEKFLVEGIGEYTKRINGYDKFQIIEVREFNQKTIRQNMQDEAKAILQEISDKDFVITLEIKGKMLSSPELAEEILKIKNYHSTSIAFVIGGSNGLDESVIERSNYHLSFSKLTFPHQLMRLIVVEQLYRAFTIINNQEYHK
ncbi:MAG: 23S rRNA (pseudouridine(1915)-N(3))-methyltransferase RlmH [Bacilli bacterium]|nr:23S rRNA (pseudouridine(1915)-N(3))-methyltransferase RlmH [Bacilli bacterium]